MNPGHMAFCASDEWRRTVRDTILPVALQGVALGADAIEIGPGPGFTTDVLRTLTSHLTAVEVDEGLAAALAERIGDGNVEVVVGDAAALDFPADRFTGAASFHMLHHIAPATQQDRVLAELARVLVPGGVLVAADGDLLRGQRTVPRGRHLQPDRPRRVGAPSGDRGLRIGRGAHLRPRVGVHGPRLLTPGPEMIAGRASLPGRDHLARLPMIVTTPDRCAIGPVGPTTNNTGTTPPGMAISPS